jgi:hypothetical protein
MKRLLGISLATAALLAGQASAATIAFDDSGVDYSDSDIETAYLSLSMSDGELVVSLADVAGTDTLLPVEFDDVPVRMRTDVFGEESYEGIFSEDRSDVLIERRAGTVERVTLIHDGVTVRDAAETYRSALAALGFDVTVERSSNGNFATVTARDADGGVQVNIRRGDRQVTASMASI